MSVYLTFTVITQSNYLNANDKLPKKDSKYTYEIVDMDIDTLLDQGNIMVKFFSLSLIVLLFSSLNKVHASQYRMYDCDNLDKSYACGSGCKISYNSFERNFLDQIELEEYQRIKLG